MDPLNNDKQFPLDEPTTTPSGVEGPEVRPTEGPEKLPIEGPVNIPPDLPSVEPIESDPHPDSPTEAPRP